MPTQLTKAEILSFISLRLKALGAPLSTRSAFVFMAESLSQADLLDVAIELT